MAKTITLEAIVYDGKSVKPDEADDWAPTTPNGKALAAVGFRQVSIYHPKYDTELIMVLDSTDGTQIRAGQAAVICDGKCVAIVDGGALDKPAPKKVEAEAPAKKVAKKR